MKPIKNITVILRFTDHQGESEEREFSVEVARDVDALAVVDIKDCLVEKFERELDKVA